jgi:hypothetical protein
MWAFAQALPGEPRQATAGPYELESQLFGLGAAVLDPALRCNVSRSKMERPTADRVTSLQCERNFDELSGRS